MQIDDAASVVDTAPGADHQRLAAAEPSQRSRTLGRTGISGAPSAIVTRCTGAGNPISGAKPFLVAALPKPAAAPKLAADGKITLDGDKSALDALASVLDDFDPSFPIVTP
ncbi:alkyl sulfatase C-terminal domain-containing protein [Nocardia sp. NPDC051833]|uniref:alkyl sulfatase C-terminal domain-containing protein n=1 Tax=Nocardia sp. NPDC051833 TaxID=3155674 RepID=UPI00342BAEF6